MNTNIHNVTKIVIGEIDSLSNSGFTRDITIHFEDEVGDYTITCFANKKENLEIEIPTVKKF